MTPTARALKQLRSEGWMAAVVEKFNPGARVRQDLFGFIDIVAVKADVPGVLGIQVTTQAHMADRVKKIQSDALAKYVNAWVFSGNAIQVWGFAKKGPRGKRKTWQLTRTRIGGGEMSGVRTLPWEAP